MGRAVVRGRLGMLVGLLALAVAPAVKADSLQFSFSGSDSDGSVNATVTFTSENGFVQVVVQNNETGTLAKGQAISTLNFSVAGGLSTPTNFTQLSGISYAPVSGQSWNDAVNGTSFTSTSNAPPINAIDHWGFTTSGSQVTLATAGSPVPSSGNPHYMILPATGTAGGGSSLANSNFYPFIIGPGTFDLTDSSITTATLLDSDITNVVLGFGTGPDTTVNGVPIITVGSGPPPAPLPASLAQGTVLTLLLGAWAAYRRRAAMIA